MENKEKIIQISSGKGPVECAWVVTQVLKIFKKEAKEQTISVEIIKSVKGEENRTLNSVSMIIKGENLDVFLKDWVGTILWIGKSMFRRFHKRKNWFIGVSEFNINNQINWNSKDIRFETFRSKGAGGQHVNKVESAVRAIHLPTGMSSTARDSRSQYQNKKIAIERLKEIVEKCKINDLKKDIMDQWIEHGLLLRGNPVRVYTGNQFIRKKLGKN